MAHSPWLLWADARRRLQRAHGGEGLPEVARVRDRPTGPLAFIDFVVIPPGASIGDHTHAMDEELYVILSGTGEMSVNGHVKTVRTGDVIHNPPGGRHQFSNTGDAPIRLVVIDLRPASDTA
jgi:quercetin dioxygenase-like cupin family protein